MISKQTQGYIKKYSKIVTVRKLCVNLIEAFITQHQREGGVNINLPDEPDRVLFEISKKVAGFYLKKLDSQPHPEIAELSSELKELLEFLKSFE